MKKKNILSGAFVVSMYFIIVSTIFSLCIVSCEKPLDDIYEYQEHNTKAGTDSTMTDSTMTTDTVSVNDWVSVPAGTVVFK